MAKILVVVTLVTAAMAAGFALIQSHRTQPADLAQSSRGAASENSSLLPDRAASSGSASLRRKLAARKARGGIATPPAENPVASNKFDRLAQIRERFRALADGDRTNALRAVKQLTDANEREAALLTLAGEWTHGELGSPVERAQAIADHGLEAGLGIQLAKSDPALAALWADELTDDKGRAAILLEAGATMLKSDPSSAFALAGELPENTRSNFVSGLFSQWAANDTEAALQWANQLPDPSEQSAAMQAIRSAAPVGIGTALKVQDGYPVITDMMAGSPADASGQLHVGDRIVGLAQGDGQYVSVQNASLQDVVNAIRGEANTVLQLQVVPADAAPDSPPQTISLTRDQIKFKR